MAFLCGILRRVDKVGSTTGMNLLSKWTVALLCLIAAGLSLWLSIEKWSGNIDSLAGCGAGSGCSNVLGSKWSVVFGSFPVSAFSFALYVSVLLSLVVRSDSASWYRKFAAWLCLSAAVWFTGLQIFVIKSLCPYCMTMHGVGVLLGLTILLSGRDKGHFSKKNLFAFVLAAFSVVVLSVVQYFGPDPLTYRVESVDKVGTGSKVVTGIHSEGEGRLVTFLDGGKSYRISQLPHLGSVDAEFVMVEYFDYTCEACREMHGYLDELITRHPAKYAAVVLPIPLHRACNPNLPHGLEDQENACELAKLGLRVWKADPEAFLKIHKNLFELQGVPIEVAQSMVYGEVGEEKMAAVDEGWVEAILAQNVKDYKQLSKKTPVMPKLLLTGSVMVQGAVKNSQALESLLDDHLGAE